MPLNKSNTRIYKLTFMLRRAQATRYCGSAPRITLQRRFLRLRSERVRRHLAGYASAPTIKTPEGLESGRMPSLRLPRLLYGTFR